MGTICVNGIRAYAYHGCLPEEGKTGGEYVVDITIETDFLKAAMNDQLEDTVDYVVVYDIVKAEMAIRSKLIEHVAQRILLSLRKAYPVVQTFTVKVTKINPPMNGVVDNVAVIVEG